MHALFSRVCRGDNNMKLLKTLGLSVVLSSSLSGQVSASTITQTSFIDLNNFITLGPADEGTRFLVMSVGLLDIQKFDTSLGTLNSATISILGDLDFAYDFSPLDVTDNLQPSSVDVTVEAGVGALVPTGLTVLSPSEFISDNFGCFGDPGSGPCFDFSGNGGPVSPANTFTGGDLAPFLGDGSPIDPFTGAGSLDDIKIGLMLSLVSLVEDNVYGTEIFMDGSFIGETTVTYDFSPAAVPLPAAAWLFASGLIGIAVPAVRRRK